MFQNGTNLEEEGGKVKKDRAMTDEQILAEVYRRLQDHSSSFGREGHLGVNRYDIKNFIEQEWEKRDS
jgi:hypothetical protein|tara:strand:+ start:137 stop:340 length:204 start_codon:yes stop_codon:yes gene_type:complete